MRRSRRRAPRPRRAEAERQLSETTATLKALAPKGLDDLRTRLAALPAPQPEDGPEPPALDSAESARAKAEAARREADLHFETARDHLETARADTARAHAGAQAAAERLSRAETGSGADPRDTGERAFGGSGRPARGRARARHGAGRGPRPGIDRRRAGARAIGGQGGSGGIARLNLDLARLDERVRRSAEGAVEERLASVAQDLETARADLSRISRDVDVLRRLESALETARVAARDRYFTPVANALRPLLHLLWPEAQLDWDDADLLPRHLIRDGNEEAIGILSGGTQEQLALLVRLAFARLLRRTDARRR